VGVIAKLRALWRRHDEKLAQRAYGDREGVERLTDLQSQRSDLTSSSRVGEPPSERPGR
jgi:hypothetical protein